ncbi:MAG: Ig-like domain-containing protein [Candidatus Limivivens sp.]|nr:Ig-like domain-containing protein [Candidatus Limivivens sp.]
MKTKTMRVWRTLLLSLMVVFAVSGVSLVQNGITAEAAGMSLSKKSATLIEGKTMSLTVKNVTRTVGWSSSNDDVVQINSVSGTKNQKVVLEAVGAGKATITAKIGNTKLTSKITVKGVTLNKKKATVNEGKTVTLTVQNPTAKVTWTTSNKKVAKIKSTSGSKRQTAVIQGLKSGKATITAKVGIKKIKCVVTVKHVHKYSKATCTRPATCSCGATKGKALGHALITQASCTQDAVCGRCYKVVTKAYGHSMSAATCTQPAKCTRCQMSFGAALGHSAPAATCTAASVCTRCHTQIAPALGHSYEAGICKRCGEIDLHHFFDMHIAFYGTADYVRVDVTNYNISDADVLYVGNRDSNTGNMAVVHSNGNNYNAVLVYDAADYQTIREDSVNVGATNYRCFFSLASEKELDVTTTIDFMIRFKGRLYKIRVNQNGFERIS